MVLERNPPESNKNLIVMGFLNVPLLVFKSPNRNWSVVAKLSLFVCSDSVGEFRVVLRVLGGGICLTTMNCLSEFATRLNHCRT